MAQWSKGPQHLTARSTTLADSRFYGYLTGVVYDRDGNLIGRCIQAYADTEENVDDWEVQWLRVEVDSGEHIFIPATGGENIYDDNGRILQERVGFSLAQVLEAPRCGSLDDDDPPTAGEEVSLYEHYFPPL
jgi:hypothetical protein